MSLVGTYPWMAPEVISISILFFKIRILFVELCSIPGEVRVHQKIRIKTESINSVDKKLVPK